MKLNKINPNSKFDAIVRVLSQGEERIITTRNSRSLKVCEFQIGDETSIELLSLYNDQIQYLENEIGNCIEIIDGWAKIFRNKLQLSLGYSGSWERFIDPDFSTIEEILKTHSTESLEEESEQSKITEKIDVDAPTQPLSDIVPETTFSTIVRIFYAHRAKSYRKVKVKSFMVGDETGIIPFTSFNDDRDNFKKMMGEVVELKNCWPHLYNGQLEISKGRRGTWKKVENQGEFITEEKLLEEYRKSQLELTDKLEFERVYYSQIKDSYYQPRGNILRHKKVKTKLELVAEPQNKYDPNAVAVFFGENKVGYIPRTQNKPIFKALTEGGPELDCSLGVYIPHNQKYTMPSKSRNPLITISTILEDIDWRPVILYAEDFIVA